MVAAASIGVNKKRKHVSKKSKTSWRKNVNIQDVEDFLEDQRLEERLGTRFADKPDSELFVIDTQPSQEEKSIKDESSLTAKQRKRLLLSKIPRCFQSLVNTSQVPEPSGKRNYLKPKGISAETERKRIEKGIYKKKLEMAQKNRELDRKRKKDLKDMRVNINKDLWNDNSGAGSLNLSEPPSEWLTKDTKDINKPMVIPARPQRKAPKAKPVVLPHPGTSYNPSFKDHQDLVKQVVQEELKVIKEENHLNRVTSGMFRKVTPAQKMIEDMNELRQGLDGAGEDSDDGYGEYRAVNPPAINKKKPRKVKTHIRQQKLIKNNKTVQLAERKKIGEIYKLRFIQKAVEKKEQLNMKLRERRKKKQLENPQLPRINRTTYKEPPPTFLEAKELSGNLRALIPKGGGLPEHFTSLQRRGLAPVSVPLKLKKAKKKKYTLPDHKMPWEITEGFAKPSKRNKN